ncbi:CLUMA_CG019144, isoform A [Clunio marinus]|uniref:CLUMA_CG019144, isoform A n=1 Tax=Clunio marinus TaxID=568069 RepID=A0A1J1J2M5_9DIPT|nr:CLUMA_CG019144, isoform A [Clunio marinus]
MRITSGNPVMRKESFAHKNRPVMISIAKSLSPTFEIPFPAVTICSEEKAVKSEIDFAKVLRNSENLTEEESSKLKALLQVCDFRDRENLQDALEVNQMEVDIVSTLEELANPMDDLFERCRYGSFRFSDCKKLFSKVITDEGICYTFNMLDRKDLFKDVYPHRVHGTGYESGLYIELKKKKSNMNPGCKRGVRGFRLTLHTPIELPLMSKDFLYIPFQKLTSIAVNPHMIYSSKDVKDYDPSSRQCYFSNERNLTFFKTYTKSGCALECLSKHVLSSCGCVKFSMPRDNLTQICDYSMLECAYEAERNLTTRDLERKLLQKQLKRALKHGEITKKDEGFKRLKKMESCNCLTTCTSLKYEPEISQTDFIISDDPEHEVTVINIYFKHAHYTRLKRYEVYALSDFLSSTGGIFGLFLGCSVLSFIEIFYHIITYCIRKVKRKTNEVNITPNIGDITRF